MQVSVEVLTIMRGEDETSAAFAGDNIKLKLKGIEEEVSSEGHSTLFEGAGEGV